MLNKYLVTLFLFTFILSCQMAKPQRYFTQEKYESGPDQSTNAALLGRLLQISKGESETMKFDFYFVTDQKQKIEALANYLKTAQKTDPDVEINELENIWELAGQSLPVQLEIDSINQWEKDMWEIGYKFDCVLDGWENADN